MSVMDEQINEKGGNVSKTNSALQEVEQYSTDKRDQDILARMGKKQVLKRNFGFLSMLSFSCTILITWEGVLMNFAPGFLNGGPVGLVGQYLLVWGGVLSSFSVVGELVSMAPTAGGQYHWVSMLAPKSSRNFLSYITGWTTCLAWVATIASGSYIAATMIQGLCLVIYPAYAEAATRWQATLMVWAVVLICLVFNTVVAWFLPHVEGGFMILHVLGFFGILIPLLYYSPKKSASELFSRQDGYLNEGGWPTYGLSFMVGTLGSAFSFVGGDAAVHMSEEIINPTLNVPRSILFSIIVNGTLGFAMLIAMLFCLGDIQAVLDAQTTIGYPYIEIFIQGVQSLGGAVAMSSIIVAMCMIATIGCLATASRMIWSFARDNGLPFSNVLSQVTSKTKVPTMAVIIASIIPCLLALINIGSSVVFNQVISLSLAGFYSTNLISCALLLYARLTNKINEPEPESTPSPAYKDKDTGEYVLTWGPWRIKGMLGTANNILAMCYLFTIFIFALFPPATPVVPSTMNYASLVFGATIIYSIIYYFIWGRRIYVGPIVEVAE